jgi:hypothetical protein
LLDDAAAEVGIDQATFRPSDGVAQHSIGDAFLARKAPEPSRLPNPQLVVPLYYNP